MGKNVAHVGPGARPRPVPADKSFPALLARLKRFLVRMPRHCPTHPLLTACAILDRTQAVSQRGHPPAWPPRMHNGATGPRRPTLMLAVRNYARLLLRSSPLFLRSQRLLRPPAPVLLISLARIGPAAQHPPQNTPNNLHSQPPDQPLLSPYRFPTTPHPSHQRSKYSQARSFRQRQWSPVPIVINSTYRQDAHNIQKPIARHTGLSKLSANPRFQTGFVRI